jgi:hypothetical protein
MEAPGQQYDKKEWRLFTGSSERSLKAVVLHNENKYASFPTAYVVHIVTIIYVWSNYCLAVHSH